MAYSKWWVTYRFSDAMRHNGATKMTPNSSNINKVIEAVLNVFIIFTRIKSTKGHKYAYAKAQKRK